MTNVLNLKVPVTYFSSNLLFKLTESFLVLLHGVMDLKILFKTLYNLKLKVSYRVSFVISNKFLPQFLEKLLVKHFFQ